MNEKQALRIWVNGPFISRKTAISWPGTGMTKERHQKWLQTLEESLRNNKEFNDWLKQALEQGKRLRLKASIFGVAQRIQLLDIHDALSQIIDEMTNFLFPREKGKSIPQVKDRHFWKVEGEKFISFEKKVEIEIEELEKNRVKQT